MLNVDTFKNLCMLAKTNKGKGKGKRTLENNFTKNEDYKITILPSENGQIAHKDIMLNVDTFKNLCMLAKINKGKVIRKYYVKLESVYNEIIKEQKDQRELEFKEQLEAKEKELLRCNSNLV